MRTQDQGVFVHSQNTSCQCRNVGESERIVSALCGGALLMSLINVRPVRGLLGALIGGTLVYRALTGHCPLYGALGINRSEEESEEGPGQTSAMSMSKRGDGRRRENPDSTNVDISSEESFPASDAPGWTRTAAT
jgi:hypothetical protein